MLKLGRKSNILSFALGCSTSTLRREHWASRWTGFLVIGICAERGLTNISRSRHTAHTLYIQNSGCGYASTLMEVTPQTVHDHANGRDNISTQWWLCVRVLVEHYEQREEPITARIKLELPQRIVENNILIGFPRGVCRIWCIQNDLHDRWQNKTANQMILIQNLWKIRQKCIENS